MEMSNRRITGIVMTFCLFCLSVPGLLAAPGGETVPRTVTVTGEGTVEAAPDIATVSIGVESFDQDVRTALAASRETIATIVEALLDLGVAAEDMQTANYSFNFDRSSGLDSGSSRGSGSGRPVYRVHNMLTVTIRNLELTGQIIDAAVLGGANQMWGLEFGIREPGPILSEATKIAVAGARERAVYLADLNDLSLGRLVSISETGGGIPPYLAAKSMGGGVHPGVIAYTVHLTVVYEIVD